MQQGCGFEAHGGGGCSFFLAPGAVSLGTQRGRAVDGAVAAGQQGAGMKRGSCPTKLNAICSAVNLMTFWAADLIRHNSRSPAWEAAQQRAAPSSSCHHAHPLLHITLHRTKALLKWDS